MVFQNYALFPHMTVAENLAFPLEVRKKSKAEIGERVQKALDMVELGAFGAAPPRRSSPAVSSSAWRWPGRWSSSPSWC